MGSLSLETNQRTTLQTCGINNEYELSGYSYFQQWKEHEIWSWTDLTLPPAVRKTLSFTYFPRAQSDTEKAVSEFVLKGIRRQEEEAKLKR